MPETMRGDPSVSSQFCDKFQPSLNINKYQYRIARRAIMRSHHKTSSAHKQPVETDTFPLSKPFLHISHPSMFPNKQHQKTNNLSPGKSSIKKHQTLRQNIKMNQAKQIKSHSSSHYQALVIKTQLKLQRVKLQIKSLRNQVEFFRNAMREMVGIIDWRMFEREEKKQMEFSIIQKLNESVMKGEEGVQRSLTLNNALEDIFHQQYQKQIKRLNMKVQLKDRQIDLLKKEHLSDRSYFQQKIRILTTKIDFIGNFEHLQQKQQKKEDQQPAPTTKQNSTLNLKNCDKIKRGICSHNKLLYNKKVIDADVAVRKYLPDPAPKEQIHKDIQQKWREREKQIYEIKDPRNNCFHTPLRRRKQNKGSNSWSSVKQLKLNSERARSLFEKNKQRNTNESEKSIQKIEHKFKQIKDMLKDSYQQLSKQAQK